MVRPGDLRGVVPRGRWPLVLGLIFLSVMVYDVFLRNQHGHLLNSSLKNMATANSSGESPDPGVGCATCYLGQDRCWAGLCQDLLKAREDAEDYFHSQVLMRVQHRLPMDNGTLLYAELQSLMTDTLYRFRNQIGIKDVAGHFWDDLEVDMGKTILSLLHLNQMAAKENNKEDQHVATLQLESECGNITVSQVKVVCLSNHITKNAKESQQRKYVEGKRRILEREYTRRANSRSERLYHQLVETEKKLKISEHDKEMLEKSVKELEQRKYEIEKRRVLDRVRAQWLNGWSRRTYDRLLLKTKEELKLQQQERKSHWPGMLMQTNLNAIKAILYVILVLYPEEVALILRFILYIILRLILVILQLTSRKSDKQNKRIRRRSSSFDFQFATTGLSINHDRSLEDLLNI